jgi:hypothetical protein
MLVKDEKLTMILKYITENPGASLYDIGKNSGVDRITAVRKIKNEHKLVENGFLRFEKGKRNAENYWITFKGLFFAVAFRSIELRNARDIRLKNKLQFSDIAAPFGMNLKPLVEDIEKDFPEQFYTVTVPARIDFPLGLVEIMPYFNALIIFGGLVKRNEPYVKRYIKGKDLVFKDGTKLEDYKAAFQAFKIIYSVFSGIEK